MKILFLHVYNEKNTGDAAIVSVMVYQYRQKYPGAEITLSSITKQEKSSFEQAPYISSFFQEAVYSSKDSSQRILKTVLIVAGVLFHGYFYKITRLFLPFVLSKPLNKFASHIKEADVIVGVGGGYILGRKSRQSTVSLMLTFLEFWFCKQLGKRVELEAMSIGPFETRFQKWMAKKVLNTMDCIQLRENISFTLLKKMNITKPEIKKTVDLAFYFHPKTKTKMRNYLMKRGVFFNKPVLGITVKKCFNDERQAQYEKSIADFVNVVTEKKDIKVVFIPHVTATFQNDDDREVIQKIKPLLLYKEKVILLMNEYNFRDIKGIYENMTWLVGTRMHSVIFALTAKVPVVAIAYEPKTDGIMALFGLQKQVVQAHEVTAEKLLRLYNLL